MADGVAAATADAADATDGDGDGDQTSPKRVDRRAVVICCAACALSDLNFSMLIPFFPVVAAEHGCSTVVTGILFGLHNVAALLITPLAPRMCHRFGASRVLLLGISIQACATLGLAATDSAQTLFVFVAACAALRCMQGFAAGLSEVSAVGLLMRSVPAEKVNHVLGWSEAARGVGIMVGPLLGGGLHQTFGYSAPFYSSSAALGALAAAMVAAPLSTPATPTGSSMRSLMCMPAVSACLLVCFSIMGSIAFLDPLLQPFLSHAPYDLTETQVGLVSSASLLCYAVVSGFAGPIASRLGNLPTLCAGLFLAGASYLALAPGPAFEWPLNLLPFLAQRTRSGALSLFVVANCAFGAAGGLAFIPANALMLDEAAARGVGIDDASDAISALAMVAFTSGAAFGPIVSGALVGALGFERSCSACALFLAAHAPLLAAVVTCARRRRAKHRGMASPLLDGRRAQQCQHGLYPTGLHGAPPLALGPSGGADACATSSTDARAAAAGGGAAVRRTPLNKTA